MGGSGYEKDLDFTSILPKKSLSLNDFDVFRSKTSLSFNKSEVWDSENVLK